MFSRKRKKDRSHLLRPLDIKICIISKISRVKFTLQFAFETNVKSRFRSTTDKIELKHFRIGKIAYNISAHLKSGFTTECFPTTSKLVV